MKQILFVLACCLALTAQQTKEKEKIEHCGLGSSHDCHCLRHSQAVEDSYLKECRLNSKTDKEMQECMSKAPSHCSIVERNDSEGDEDGAEAQDSAMSEHCAMMCKKHDCLCDDGPRCHIGHDASEHEQSDSNNKPPK
jgi:hypothetical protein